MEKDSHVRFEQAKVIKMCCWSNLEVYNADLHLPAMIISYSSTHESKTRFNSGKTQSRQGIIALTNKHKSLASITLFKRAFPFFIH